MKAAMNRVLLISGLLFRCLASSLTEAAPAPPIVFQDVTQDAGITFRHTDGSAGKRFLVESVASGLATFDFDGDGRIDILFLNGQALAGENAQSLPSRNALYRNLGGWRFEDVTVSAGLDRSGYHLGVAVADYDGDGHLDLYLSNFGPDTLYRNNGNGTFTDVTQQAGVANGDQVGAGAAFLDIEGDGDLDLFVANYCGFTLEKHQDRQINGYPAYAGPAIYGPLPDTLFRNNGDGTFTDISQSSGIAAKPGTGMGLVCVDYDDDGDTDIIVGNDALANYVWRNEGGGRFKEVGLFSGLAYDANGIGLGTMGVDCADYNNDGKLDFYMTSYQKQWATLYRNDGRGLFSDVTHTTGGGTGTYGEVTWGLGMVDFDNDGFRDLFVACGHLQDNIALWDDTVAFESANIVLHNQAGKRFQRVMAGGGNGMAVRGSSRGAAFDDLDNDGDVDAVVLNTRAAPTLLRNDSVNKNHWLQVRIRGNGPNREGIGARVTVVAGDLVQSDEVRSGRSYQSHFGLTLHFGLGARTEIDRVEVRWPSGGESTLRDLKADQLLQIEKP